MNISQTERIKKMSNEQTCALLEGYVFTDMNLCVSAPITDEEIRNYLAGVDVSSDEVFLHTFAVTASSHVENMAKGQDMVRNGRATSVVTGREFDWWLLCDGHGTSQVINALRTVDLNPLVAQSDPAEALQTYLKDNNVITIGLTSGATMVLTRVFSDYAECISVGDSEFRVYEDNTLVYKSTTHSPDNAEEIQRLRKTHPLATISEETRPILLSETRISNQSAKRVYFGNGVVLAPTQALGHKGVTGLAPEVYTISFQPGRSYRIIAGSDGVFDMEIPECEKDIHVLQKGTAEEIVTFYKNRWLQIWEYMETPSSKAVKQRFRWTEAQSDDISAYVISIL